MLISQAHSVRQQQRLAISLAWIGGYTNILALLVCGAVVSHTSGTASNFGRGVAEGDWPQVAFWGHLLLTFLAGAALSGFCTELGRRRQWQSIFVLPILLEAVLLSLFAWLLSVGWFTQGDHGARDWVMIGLASAAMGLQNATITRISSGTVRTTHVTGVLTDLGHEGVQFLWSLFDAETAGPGKRLNWRLFTQPKAVRLALLASILATFMLGAGLAVVAHSHLALLAMWPPVVFLLLIIWMQVSQPVAVIVPAEAPGEPVSSLAVFRLRKRAGRGGKFHRMPNLIAWAEGLPPTVRVVVLDLGDAVELTQNSAMEISAVSRRFAALGGGLVIAGVAREPLRKALESSEEGAVALDNLCGDFDLAIARAVNLLG